MKKLLLFGLLVLASVSSYAQEPTRCRAITRWGQCTNETNWKTDTLCVLHKHQARMAEAAARPAVVTQQPITTQSTRTSRSSSKSTSGMRCIARTKKGTQCTRTASAGSKYCWQHAR